MARDPDEFVSLHMVEQGDACPAPGCGERDIDRLAWIDDDTVRCASCGTEYDPLVRANGGDDAAR